ncbi:MAG: response regulator [Gammaproteobacteria bacterium]|nr:response regulator [Gammaproteobacteria bacterium]
MKVLIVEDDPAIRMLHQRQLTHWGYHVDLAVNGEGAIERVQENEKKGAVNYDLCLMDVNMPVMDGIEAIHEIRKNTIYLPVIAYSADSDNKIPCLEAGADKFLLKPHPAAELKKTLEEFTVKQNVLYLNGESLSVNKVGPADSEELIELRMLDKKGVTKFTVVDVSCRFLAYKNMKNELLDNFGGDNSETNEILGCTEQECEQVQIYVSRKYLKKTHLTPKEFWVKVTRENEILKRYFSTWDKYG